MSTNEIHEVDPDVLSPFFSVHEDGYVFVGPLGRRKVAEKWREKYNEIGYDAQIAESPHPHVHICERCSIQLTEQKTRGTRTAETWEGVDAYCPSCCEIEYGEQMDELSEKLRDLVEDERRYG